MRQDAMNGMRSLRPLFAKVGWPQSILDQWAERVERGMSHFMHTRNLTQLLITRANRHEELPFAASEACMG
jgi:hypothetical protein